MENVVLNWIAALAAICTAVVAVALYRFAVIVPKPGHFRGPNGVRTLAYAKTEARLWEISKVQALDPGLWLDLTIYGPVDDYGHPAVLPAGSPAKSLTFNPPAESISFIALSAGEPVTTRTVRIRLRVSAQARILGVSWPFSGSLDLDV